MAIKRQLNEDGSYQVGLDEIYEPCVVAWIDILGFKSALENEAKAKDILKTLSELREEIAEIDSHYKMFADAGYGGLGHTQITAFSDSILISEQYCFANLVVMDTLKLSQLLIKKGFLCRGAIVCGELYHKNGIVFGNGLVEACNNEKTLAKYPRVILDSQTVEWLANNMSASDDYLRLIKLDKDGARFLNILFEDDSLKAYLCDLVQKELLKGTEENPISPCIKQKLIWLKNEYNLV